MASELKLSSGKKFSDSKEDSGAYRQAVILESDIGRKKHTLNNLQSLISFSQSQLNGLNQAGEIVLRMNELAQLSLDEMKTNADRTNYDFEFQELAQQLDSINKMNFNGLDLFSDGPFSDEKKQFIQILQTQWLKAAEKVIQERLGLVGTGRDTFKINVNDTGNEMYSISLTWNYSDPDSPDKSADVASLNYEIYNYNLPVSAPPEDPGLNLTDRINAVMITYAVLADNLHFNALANGDVKKGASNSGGAEWFKSGVADFVHGGDYLLEYYTGGFTQATIDSIGSGDAQASSYSQKASYYAAVRFLHDELKKTGVTDGIKGMLSWMTNGVKNGLSSKETSVGAALQHFFGSSNYSNAKTANDQFVQHYIDNALNAHNDPTDSFKMLLFDDDTGAISGANADRGLIITHKEAVPDSGDGYDPTPASTKPFDNFEVKWEKEGIPLTIPNEDGEELVFKFTNSLTIDDKESYNLRSDSSSKLTLRLLENWVNKINEQRATVSSNLNTLNVSVEKLQTSLANYSNAVSRISDTDYAKETTTLVKNKIRTENSISILSKANDNKFSIGQLLEGIQIPLKKS